MSACLLLPLQPGRLTMMAFGLLRHNRLFVVLYLHAAAVASCEPLLLLLLPSSTSLHSSSMPTARIGIEIPKNPLRNLARNMTSFLPSRFQSFKEKKKSSNVSTTAELKLEQSLNRSEQTRLTCYYYHFWPHLMRNRDKQPAMGVAQAFNSSRLGKAQ
ncbi:hypothetical protein M513_13471 [Trichuris suis]|uniref:Uncharacterized protein n=1 Tax=Trichuris suis TaxID=68888 RepID=A0A085LL01_9BILA|nr:hypothetical protein M513_13641 [Trichuris suis]KFD45647.1 hypothetical protein M513_13471 [Trichuris suis]